jgi:hypothetical protein
MTPLITYPLLALGIFSASAPIPQQGLVSRGLAKSASFPDLNPELTHLIIVPCHAIYTSLDFSESAIYDANNWFLFDYQRGQQGEFVEHIKMGLKAAALDPKSMLMFSGGQTRLAAGPKSEADTYVLISQGLNWMGHKEVASRIATEESARDSFENLLFSVCRFKQMNGT